jgi:hypothetical protein
MALTNVTYVRTSEKKVLGLFLTGVDVVILKYFRRKIRRKNIVVPPPKKKNNASL